MAKPAKDCVRLPGHFTFTTTPPSPQAQRIENSIVVVFAALRVVSGDYIGFEPFLAPN